MSSVVHRFTTRRAFVVSLLVSALLWWVSAMSEERQFDATVRIEWTGFDTARYAIASADTSVRVTITSSGFAAIGRDRYLRSTAYVLYAQTDTSIAIADHVSSMASALELPGVTAISARGENVSLRLSQRARRPYSPQLDQLKLTFAEPYGLAGEPIIEPDTVWLYGSEEALDQIALLPILPTTLTDITTTRSYTLHLDPVWRQFQNVSSSTETISITLPTAVYTEQSFQVPVAIAGAEDVNMRLYPEQVDVTLWVANESEHQLASDMIHLAVDYSAADTSSDRLTVRATGFPSFVRIKKIEPSEVSYIIIRK